MKPVLSVTRREVIEILGGCFSGNGFVVVSMSTKTHKCTKFHAYKAKIYSYSSLPFVPLICTVKQMEKNMCGIIGFTGKKNAVPLLLEGLSALEYRGYDSAGVAIFGQSGKLETCKTKGRLAFLAEKIENLDKPFEGMCGIGHTRWATHGEPSDTNSHPHGTGRMYLVHNGIIENYSELKKVLLEKGYTFESETDTEIAAKLIDYYYGQTKDPYEAFSKAIKELSGSYALGAVFEDHPGKIFCTRKDNPLIIAVSDEGNFIASDIPAVLKHTRKYYHIFEGEIAEVTADSVTIFDENRKPVTRNLEEANWDIEAAEKGGYAHFMIKEINEEPDAIVKTLRPRIKNGMPDFGVDVLTDEKLRSFERIHVVACGTAMHAGLIGKNAAESLARVPVDVEIASEFRYKNPILSKNDLAIIISQSGETADTLAALRLCKAQGVFTLGIVNVAGSTIAREADAVIYTWAGPEIAVASTKAYTVQISVMYLFALRLAYACGKLTEDETKALVDELLNKAPKTVEKVIANEEHIKKISDKYKNATDIFYLGRGIDYALAMEASLKLKEISYIHCEAYAAGELKHGTISLVTDGVPVFALCNVDSLYEKMISNIKEVKARGADVIMICREKDADKIPEEIADDIILLPELTELFMGIPVATAVQLIAYYTSVQLGCDVDKPRNLAKSVTVE